MCALGVFLHKKIITLSLPLVLSNISVPLLGLVNSALMGHMPTSQYLTAVALGATAVNFISYLFYFLRMSTTGAVAQAYQSGDFHAMRLWLYRGLLTAVVIGVLLIILQLPIAILIQHLVHIQPDVAALFQSYFHIVIYLFIFVLINYVLLGFFIAVQRAFLALVMALITNILGIVLSLFFVLGLSLDVKGVAYSGVLAQGVTALFALMFVYKFFREKKIPLLSDLRLSMLFNLKEYGQFFSVNSNIFIRSVCLLVSINSFLIFSSYMGKDDLAANALLVEFAVFLSMFLDALSNATETLVAESYVKSTKDKLKQVLKLTLSYAFSLSVVFVLIYAFIYPWIIQLLTSIESVQLVADQYVIFSIIFPLIAVFSYWLDGVYIGLLKTTTMRNAMIVSMLGYFVLVLVLWPFANTGLWLAYLGFFVLRSITLWLPLKRFV